MTTDEPGRPEPEPWPRAPEPAAAPQPDSAASPPGLPCQIPVSRRGRDAVQSSAAAVFAPPDDVASLSPPYPAGGERVTARDDGRPAWPPAHRAAIARCRNRPGLPVRHLAHCPTRRNQWTQPAAGAPDGARMPGRVYQLALAPGGPRATRLRRYSGSRAPDKAGDQSATAAGAAYPGAAQATGQEAAPGRRAPRRAGTAPAGQPRWTAGHPPPGPRTPWACRQRAKRPRTGASSRSACLSR